MRQSVTGDATLERVLTVSWENPVANYGSVLRSKMSLSPKAQTSY
jgi:hypothetical protein